MPELAKVVAVTVPKPISLEPAASVSDEFAPLDVSVSPPSWISPLLTTAAFAVVQPRPASSCSSPEAPMVVSGEFDRDWAAGARVLVEELRAGPAEDHVGVEGRDRGEAVHLQRRARLGLVGSARQGVRDEVGEGRRTDGRRFAVGDVDRAAVGECRRRNGEGLGSLGADRAAVGESVSVDLQGEREAERIFYASHNKLLNLRTDPYERADITSNTYYDWALERAYLFVPAQDYVGQFLSTFKDYPPRQKAASFNMDDVLSKMKESGGGPRIERPGAPPAACGRPLVAVAQKTGGVPLKIQDESHPAGGHP